MSGPVFRGATPSLPPAFEISYSMFNKADGVYFYNHGVRETTPRYVIKDNIFGPGSRVYPTRNGQIDYKIPEIKIPEIKIPEIPKFKNEKSND